MSIRKLLNEYDYHHLVTTTPINKRRNRNPFTELTKDFKTGGLDSILIGDSIVAGLFRYDDVSKI